MQLDWRRQGSQCSQSAGTATIPESEMLSLDLRAHQHPRRSQEQGHLELYRREAAGHGLATHPALRARPTDPTQAFSAVSLLLSFVCVCVASVLRLCGVCAGFVERFLWGVSLMGLHRRRRCCLVLLCTGSSALTGFAFVVLWSAS